MTALHRIGILKQSSVGRPLRRVAALILLLSPVFFLPPVPIDETRYLAVAWHMHSSGQWLVPWLDGAAYSDKAPLLFWLINLAWSVTGVHAWAVRLLELLLGLSTLPLLGSLGRRLGADDAATENAQWLWLGCMALAIYADVIMFDLLLTFCTLTAWLATTILAGRRWPAGVLLMGLALGAGILAKGPVALLVGGLPALFASYWMPGFQTRPAVFYLRLFIVLLASVLLALAWAIPAAQAGGPAYADAIFLRQTMGRVVHSFAHARPWWWYLPILPAMTLPWTLCLARHAPIASASRSTAKAIGRFAATAVIPGFVVFSLISGKQPHYLLPLIPPLALFAGERIGSGRWRIVAWRTAPTFITVGLAVALGLGWREAPDSAMGAVACGVLIVLLGVSYLVPRAQPPSASAVALGTLAAVMLCKLAFVLSIGPRYDVRAMAQHVAAAQRDGIPMLFAGSQYGLLTFAGRLTAAIPDTRDPAAVAAWVHAHPDGWVISDDNDYQDMPAPLYKQAYFGRSLGIWPASAVAAEADRKREIPTPAPNPGED
ncbi:phospholipid carrier-dependent glycosyltransferase [Dyella agri]|uniref:Phospholipid carrier-dependent glycosyltransferase n=2 Tax=Dyella agri TaxID=1926869 RepID=A0ABW8KG73_9GAMM